MSGLLQIYLVLMATLTCLTVITIGGDSEGCTEGGKEYDHGETWTCSDGCNTCVCSNGTVSATKKACPSKKCPIKGQIWYSECAPYDGTCRNPIVECPLLCQPGCACPKGQVIKNGKKCVKPRRCPKKGCTEGGNEYKHGQTWVCSDGCNQCRCKNGQVMSTKKACS